MSSQAQALRLLFSAPAARRPSSGSLGFGFQRFSSSAFQRLPLWSLLLGMLPIVVHAQFTFTTNNGAITITGYTGSGGAVTIPSATNGYPVTTIGHWAFYSSTNLTSVMIPATVTSIGEVVFASCSRLTSATIPNSVTNMGNSVFAFCSALTTATIGTNVTRIGNEAFYECTSLTNVIIGSSVTNIVGSALSGCSNLTAITVDTNNSTFSSLDGVLFNKSRTTLIEFPHGKGPNYAIPNGAKSIGSDAFSACTRLTSITIPNSITNIGDRAFCECLSLTGVYFQGDAPGIGSYLFLHYLPGPDTNIEATIYFLPGATGWGPLFGGRPTVLWNPQALTSDGGFGVRSNRFGFNITGSSNLVIVVETCTRLANATWSPVSTNTLNTFIGTNGTSYFSDPLWTNYPSRFYRLRSP